MTGFADPESVPIPATHLDLLTRPISGVLTTMGDDGHPQSSLVWVDVDHGFARFNTTLERQQGRNLMANPKVSLLVVDPDNTSRFIQIRGDVELTTDDTLTRDCIRHPGQTHHVAQQGGETCVTCRIHARRVTLDAIHASS